MESITSIAILSAVGSGFTFGSSDVFAGIIIGLLAVATLGVGLAGSRVPSSAPSLRAARPAGAN